MKHITVIAAILLLAAQPFRAAEAPNAQDQQIAALMKELQAQNLALAQNQAAIEAKLATLAETVRQARIFTSRAAGVR